MNIFFLDEDPQVAASLYCDEHFKIRLEASQMLSTSYHWYKPEIIEKRDTGCVDDKGEPIFNYFVNEHRIYKQAFVYHPTSEWVRNTQGNWDWTLEHLKALQKIWVDSGRNGEITDIMITSFTETRSVLQLVCGMTDVPLAMYEEIKRKYSDLPLYISLKGKTVRVDMPVAVAAYREYLCAKVFKNDKRPTWTINPQPEWYHAS